MPHLSASRFEEGEEEIVHVIPEHHVDTALNLTYWEV